jgi:hypothetical protein
LRITGTTRQQSPGSIPEAAARAGIAFALGGCTVTAILLHEMLLKPVQAIAVHLSP